MNPRCIMAVSQAIGRALTRREAEGIDARVRNELRLMAVQDRAAFLAASREQRFAMAAQRVGAKIVEEAREAQTRALLSVQKHDYNVLLSMQMRGLDVDAQEALRRRLDIYDDGKTRGSSLEQTAHAIDNDYARRMHDIFAFITPRIFGLFSQIEHAKLVERELFGENTGSTIARKVAQEWYKLLDAMNAQWRAAGGVLHPLEDYHIPQHHDQVKVFGRGGEAAMREWVDHIGPLLKRERYVHDDGRLYSDAEFRALLEHAWESIVSDGANERAPGQRRATPVAMRETAHRVLHFKDAASYRAYQDRYGGMDLYNVMRGHISRMSRRIAQMEEFGPNADREVAFLNDMALKDAATTNMNAAGEHEKIAKLYNYVAGYSQGVANAGLARAFEIARNWQIPTKLMSAVISSLPDVTTMFAMSRVAQVPVVRTYFNALRAMVGTEGGRAELERQGLMMSAHMEGGRRFQMSTFGQSWDGRLAQAALRASGLVRWTNADRAGYSSNRMHRMAELTAQHETLAGLPEDIRAPLEARGITEADWQVWRQATPMESAHGFGRMLTPDSVYAIEGVSLAERRRAAQHLLGLSYAESAMAVIEPGAKQKFALGAAGARGDPKVELANSVFQFKTFTYSLFDKQFMQAGWSGHDTVGGRIQYILPLFIGLALMGAATNAIKDLLVGRNPRPLWDDKPDVVLKNLIAAIVSGGGGGLYMDFLAAEAGPDWRQGLASFAGPVAGMTGQAISATLGNAIQAAGDKPTNSTFELLQLAKSLTPTQNFWVTKAAIDHYFWDRMMEAANPGYLYRSERHARREFGSEYWWPRGEDFGRARAPDLSTSFGR